MSLKRKGKSRSSRRGRIAQKRKELLIQKAVPTAPYVMYHDPRGVNDSGGRHIPETDVGYRMVDKRVVIGADRYLVNKDLTIEVCGNEVAIANIMAAVAWTNQEMHSSWATKTRLPGSDMEASRLEVMMPDLKAVSAMTASTLGRGIASFAENKLTLNPKQAGFPDLIPTGLYNKLIKQHRAWIDDRTKEKVEWTRVDKGIEMKGTCGTVKEAELSYPYDASRVDMLNGINFQAHHDCNTVLLGVLWDHIAGAPQIVGVFYACNLVKGDFTESKKEKDLGNRTTRVCSLTRAGKNKFSYVCMLNDARYIGAIIEKLPYCGL